MKANGCNKRPRVSGVVLRHNRNCFKVCYVQEDTTFSCAFTKFLPRARNGEIRDQGIQTPWSFSAGNYSPVSRSGAFLRYPTEKTRILFHQSYLSRKVIAPLQKEARVCVRHRAAVRVLCNDQATGGNITKTRRKTRPTKQKKTGKERVLQCIEDGNIRKQHMLKNGVVSH